jgi:hypothetical protein
MEQIFINYAFAIADHIPRDEVEEVRKKIQNPQW